jgi:hypothetical protein
MKFLKERIKSQRQGRRLAVVSALSMLALVSVFGASFAIAQEQDDGFVFMPWYALASGGAHMEGNNNTMRVVVGQSAIGEAETGRNRPDDDQYQITLGYNAVELVGTEGFAQAVPSVTPTQPPANTPTATATMPSIETPTQTPTEVATSPTATQAPATATATTTRTPVPPTETPTSSPTQPPVTPTETLAPSTATATVSPTATATTVPPATVVAATATPEPVTPTATPEPTGGVCSLPQGEGPRPLDVGLLLVLATPFLWRLWTRI